MYQHLTYEQCAARYPRLIRAMQWTAILSSGEAACGLRDYRDAREALQGRSPFTGATIRIEDDWKAYGRDIMRFGGSEAVAHFGGPLRLVQRAVACRHCVKS
jgi:hypothetical protein